MSEEKWSFNDDNWWTILNDRYTGIYAAEHYAQGRVGSQAAQCTAWPLLPNQIPEDIWGDDGDCREAWWNVYTLDVPVGLGATPAEALEDLHKQIRMREPEYMKMLNDATWDYDSWDEIRKTVEDFLVKKQHGDSHESTSD